MNVFGVVIAIALLAEYALRIAADLLNLKALETEVPREFSGFYDAERYQRSQDYTRARTRFGLVPSTLYLASFLTFWFAGGFRWLDDALRAFALSPIPTGLLFIGCLALARALLALPFRWVSTFVIEDRFGFNTTTPRTFVSDAAKSALLAVALGGPLLAVVLWLFQAAGPLAWLWCWLATALFTLFVHLIAPTWIFPLFNKFEPLEEGRVRESIERYARQVGFPLAGIFVIDGSRRSTKANAFFTGFGRTKRVALFDTLIERHRPDELVAIVAHEIGHYKAGHIKKRLTFSLAYSGVAFFLLSVLLESRGLFGAFFLEDPSVYAGLVFFGLLFSPIDLGLSLFLQSVSRRHEFEADAYARQGGLAAPLVRALKRLSAESLANLTPHPLYVKLHYSHPPPTQRVAALQDAG